MIDMFQMSFESALDELKDTLSIILAQIKDRNPYIMKEDFMDLRLIFTELLANAVTHGNKGDIRKRVYVAIEFYSEGVRSKVIDEGKGFNFMEALNSDSYLSETGRGIKLVSALADELFVNSEGNEIQFIKRFSYTPASNPTLPESIAN